MQLIKVHTSQEAPTSTSGSSSLACSNTDNQTKYVDRKAPKEKEEIVETVQKQNDSSYNTAFENVTTQLARDMIDLGLKVIISLIIPNAFDQENFQNNIKNYYELIKVCNSSFLLKKFLIFFTKS